VSRLFFTWHFFDTQFVQAKTMANSWSQLLTITKRLPPEIMSEIFILCPPLTTHSPRLNDFHRDISLPLSLSSVCRLWRSIAHSTPALWTSFRIYIPSRDFPQRIQQAKQWLSRSRQLPLSIRILSHPSVSLNPLDPRVGELIDLVNSYSHRWESLEIRLSLPLLYCFAGLGKSPSMLKTFILSPSGICCIRFLGIHSNNLTHFAVDFISVGQALKILRLSPQLKECTLTALWPSVYDDIPLPSSPLLLAHLETLHMCAFESDPCRLLDNINLPSLKNFTYSAGPAVSALPFDGMVAFLDRSGCLLESFSLQGVVVSQDGIIRLLYAMPHLDTLTLGGPFIDRTCLTDGVLKMLADTATISACRNNQPDGPFLPKLRSLKYIARPLFSLNCIPIVFGRCGTKEPGRSKSPTSNQRPLFSFRMELYFDKDLDQSPDATVVAELNRLRAEEGYDIQILDACGEVDW